VMVMTTSNITEAIDLAFVDRSIYVCANEYLCRVRICGYKYMQKLLISLSLLGVSVFVRMNICVGYVFADIGV